MNIQNDQNLDLIIKYFRKNLSENEGIQLFEWISQNKENESLLFRIKDIYEAGNWDTIKKEANTVEEWIKLSSKIVKKEHKLIKVQPVHPIHKQLFSYVKYAALVAIGMFMMFFINQFVNNQKSRELTVTKIITGIGERTQTILPDGTKVWINSCSMLSYNSNYGKNSRQINLLGEAYFDVKKDTKRPFFVKVAEITVKALGTSFNVTYYPNDIDISVVLVEGSVSLIHKNLLGQTILRPGQRASYSLKNKEISCKNVDAELYTKWPRGEYKFDQLTFFEIAKRLERNYHVTFVFMNHKMKELTFTGSFQNYESLDQILHVIKTNTAMNYTIKKDTIFIK